MSAHVVFLVLGLGAGAVYVLLALGLVLEYRSSGVVNFAHGAIATLISYVFIELRSTGVLVLPWLGLPNRIHITRSGFSLAPAMIVALAYGAALGCILYLLVFRPLRRAPALGKVVASVGVMLVLQSLVVIEFGSSAKSTGPVLPNEPVKLFGQFVPRDRLWLAAVALAMTALLWAVFRFTRFGLATRAAAESEKGAALLGYSSDRIAVANWVLASMLAGVAGILLVPITALIPSQYSLLVVPALGVALVGRFRSFALTAVAGLALGMAQSEITKLQTDYSWFPKYGVKEGLPLLMIIVAMTVFGRSLPERGAIIERRFPKAARPGSPWMPALVGSCLAVGSLFLLQGSYRSGLIQSLISGLLCISLVVLTGYVGQISLAQMSFAGVSGLGVSKLALDAGVPFPAALALAAVLAVPIGLLFALPALRVRGVELAVITVAAAVAVDQFVFNNPDITGLAGIKVPPPKFLGIDLNVRSANIDDYPRVAFGLFVLAVLVLVAIAVTNLRRNATGRRWLAVRANERAAAAVGIDVRSTKLLAFGFSAFIAGLAGGVIGYQLGVLSAGSFGVFSSLSLLAVAYLGGIGRVSGAIAAGLIFAAGGVVSVALDRWINAGRYEVLISGIGLIAVAIVHPDGLATEFERPAHAFRRLLRRLAMRFQGAASVPRGPADAPRVEPASAHHATSVVSPPARRPIVDATPVLSVNALSVSFGGLNALDDIRLEVPRGSLVGLIGPNGAGKTTFIDAVSGYLPQARGAVHFDGQLINGLRVHQRARLGLGRTFQSVELFDDLTVLENVLVAAEPAKWWSGFADTVRYRPGHLDDALWALDLVGLHCAMDAVPSELPHGQRKLVGIARAIARRPKLVLLDEPAAGLDNNESLDLGRRLEGLRDAEIDVLLVDHDMGLVLGVCDAIWVLDFGQLVAHGPPRAIRDDPAVIGAYLGNPTDAVAAAAAGLVEQHSVVETP